MSLLWLHQGLYQHSLIHFQPSNFIREHHHVALLVQEPFLLHKGRPRRPAAANEAEAKIGSPIVGIFKSMDLVEQNTMIAIIGHQIGAKNDPQKVVNAHNHTYLFN